MLLAGVAIGMAGGAVLFGDRGSYSTAIGDDRFSLRTVGDGLVQQRLAGRAQIRIFDDEALSRDAARQAEGTLWEPALELMESETEPGTTIQLRFDSRPGRVWTFSISHDDGGLSVACMRDDENFRLIPEDADTSFDFDGDGVVDRVYLYPERQLMDVRLVPTE
ncbi:MAG: hypothetical protein AAFR38_08720 [Planctomycetota bacterium]